MNSRIKPKTAQQKGPRSQRDYFGHSDTNL